MVLPSFVRQDRWKGTTPSRATGGFPHDSGRRFQCRVQRSAAGAFTLRAIDGADAAELSIKAAEAASVAQQLPYIGAGWGSIVVGLAIASVTGALGLKGTISAEAVATILGALVGYVVAKGQAETSKTEGSSSEAKT